jgi:hypothetical protein
MRSVKLYLPCRVLLLHLLTEEMKRFGILVIREATKRGSVTVWKGGKKYSLAAIEREIDECEVRVDIFNNPEDRTDRVSMEGNVRNFAIRNEDEAEWTYQVMRDEVVREKSQTTTENIQQKGILALYIFRNRCKCGLDISCCPGEQMGDCWCCAWEEGRWKRK